MNSSFERDQSEFNMAISYLNRLNALFYQADGSAMSLDSFGWFHALNAIFRELSTEMNEKEKTEGNQTILDLGKNISAYIKKSSKEVQQGIPTEIYMGLHNFEIFLRNLVLYKPHHK